MTNKGEPKISFLHSCNVSCFRHYPQRLYNTKGCITCNMFTIDELSEHNGCIPTNRSNFGPIIHFTGVLLDFTKTEICLRNILNCARRRCACILCMVYALLSIFHFIPFSGFEVMFCGNSIASSKSFGELPKCLLEDTGSISHGSCISARMKCQEHSRTSIYVYINNTLKKNNGFRLMN